MPARGARLKQRIRQLPGTGVLQVRLQGLLRRSRTMRAIVRRVYAVDASAHAPVDVAPGRLVDGPGAESLPVVLVVMLDADAQTIDKTIDDVARLQLMTAGFRPVFVVDTPAFAATRRYGFPVELLVAERDWRDPSWTWDEYTRRVLALVFEGYRATAAVTLGEEGLDPAAKAVLGSLRPARRQALTGTSFG